MGLAPNRSITFAGDSAACEVPAPNFFTASPCDWPLSSPQDAFHHQRGGRLWPLGHNGE